MSAWSRTHPPSADHRYDPLHEDLGGVRITRCKTCGLAGAIDSDKFEHGMPPALMSLIREELARWDMAGGDPV